MKKMIAAAAALLAGTLAGCGMLLDVSVPLGLAGTKEGSRGTVTAEGSTSMEQVIGFLGEAYMEENKDVKVMFNPTGSSAGIQAVSEGRCDIGLSSRALEGEEGESLDAVVIAIDGIALLIHPDNPVTDLSLEQVGRIYAGEIQNWEEVGGEDAPIVCIGREAASGTRDGFEEVTGTKGRCAYSQELTSSGDVVQTVAGNPNAIGYASVASLNGSVKAVSVDGVEPTAGAIREGRYPVRRDFILVTRKDEPLSGAARDFYEFATGVEAEKWISLAGAVPAGR